MKRIKETSHAAASHTQSQSLGTKSLIGTDLNSQSPVGIIQYAHVTTGDTCPGQGEPGRLAVGHRYAQQATCPVGGNFYKPHPLMDKFHRGDRRTVGVAQLAVGRKGQALTVRQLKSHTARQALRDIAAFRIES